MENKLAKQLFAEQFKLAVNQEVRHKGDSKNSSSYGADMGLLILERLISETIDDDGNFNYTRLYHCRMIRFSGSGDVARFKESELMTVEEYDKRTVEREQEREDMRNKIYVAKQKIFESFGVKRGMEVYLKTNGVADKNHIYAVSGYSSSEEGTFIILHREAGEGRRADEYRAKSRDEFEIITK